MKLPLSYIKSFINNNLNLETCIDSLIELGIEVDHVFAPKPPFHGVIIAEIAQVRKHESSDKLQVAQVFDGEKTWEVVCGAPNCRSGIKTAFAKIGATLFNEDQKPFAIVPTTIRGISSYGMLCSAKELNLYDDHSQILEFPSTFQTGADCLPLLWDPVLEISLTPNLGHCMSALGIARELSAALQIPLELPSIQIKPISSQKRAEVVVKNEKLCPRYTAKIIENVKVGPSPFWLQKKLLSADLNPINNVVDAINYLTLKNGLPMHAFDFDAIEGKKIIVQTAETPISFQTLTDIDIEVPKGTLLICDEKKPIAIAGIMGGKNSCTTEKTQTILLEAAAFDPIAIRVASKKMGLRSESSIRYEKGVDIGSIPQLLEEAAALIAELSGGHVSDQIIDCGRKEFSRKEIAYRPSRVNQILGTHLSESEISDIFIRLGFELKKDNRVLIPHFRNDIHEEIDLIEEVARIYGYNHIQRTLPKATSPQIPNDPTYLFETELRSRMIGLGAQEFLTCDLISPKKIDLIPELSSTMRLLKTLHSKSEDYSILRPSLLPGLLDSIRLNFDQKNNRICAFEIGRVHFQNKETPIEYPMCAVVLSGKARPSHWEQKPIDFDFFDLKGMIENLLMGLRYPSIQIKPSKHPTFHPSRQAEIFIEDLCVGSLGEIHPNILEKMDIDQKVYYAELNVDYLQNKKPAPSKMKPLPLFPSSERDWTLPLDPKTPIQTIFHAIQSTQIRLLEHFELIDLYSTEDKVHLTLRFTYRDPSKTVSFEEVETSHHRLIEEVLAKTKTSR